MARCCANRRAWETSIPWTYRQINSQRRTWHGRKREDWLISKGVALDDYVNEIAGDYEEPDEYGV